ncbi:sugar kinase [Devosia yakushimensis]|uniref:Sugar kinase n=1 Tax=Devosia yakushimensis TaxID=470028 RepID=A0ABQ5UKH6_9HYPH|nr:ROK family transcriptional regulator [Devosia yakushimensis]GLQ12133.1 sugar kinase [Devosia yakushimensis]
MIDSKKLPRVRNRYIVLEYLRRASNSTPSEISAATGVSLPTVTRVLSSLVEEGLVEYTGREASTGGRPAGLVTFTGHRYGTVCLYAHTSGIYGVLSDLSGRITVEKKVAPAFDGEVNTQIVLDLIRELLEIGRRDFDGICGLGVAVQSMVKQPKGEVVRTSAALDWRSLPLHSVLCAHFDLPIFVDSDHIYGVIGEWNYGSSRHVDILVRLSLGPGASTGLMVNGEVYRGAADAAGELKWYLDDSQVSGVQFPLLGTKEELRLGKGLTEQVFDALSSAADAYEAGKLDLGIFDSEISGDLRLETARQLIGYSSLAIGSASAILSPTTIVLSGQINRGRQLILDIFNSRLGGDVWPVPRIVHSGLGHRAVLLGAAKTVMDQTMLKPDTILETSHDVLAAASR